MYEFNGGALNMLLDKMDFCSALMKMSLPVKQYAGTVQAAGGGIIFLPSYLEYTIARIPGRVAGQSGEFRTVSIVGGMK
jgi:hypothetical protein